MFSIVLDLVGILRLIMDLDLVGIKVYHRFRFSRDYGLSWI